MAFLCWTTHSTGNLKSIARGEAKNIVRMNNQRKASFRIAVDDKEAVEGVLLNEVVWHTADGVKGADNLKSVQTKGVLRNEQVSRVHRRKRGFYQKISKSHT